MIEETRWCLDGCCHRASLGSILLHWGTDPALILGPALFSSAQEEGGLLRFGKDFLAKMVDLCRRRGLETEVVPAAAPQAWEWAKSHLERDVPLAAVVDAFYLPYFYRDHKVFHHPHMIVVDGYSAGDDRVHVIDADNTTRFGGWMDRAQLRRAQQSQWPLLLQRSQYGATWVRVERPGTHRLDSATLLQDLHRAAGNLVRNNDADLSPVQIVLSIVANLEHYLAISVLPGCHFATWKDSSSFHRGLRFTSHALRWLAKSIHSLSACMGIGSLDPFSRTVSDMAEAWMALRALYIHYGLCGERRRSSLAQEIGALAAQLESRARSCSVELQQHSVQLLEEQCCRRR